MLHILEQIKQGLGDKTPQPTRINLAADTTSEPVYLQSYPVTVAVMPGANGSMLVEYSLSPRELIESGQGQWHAWNAGAVNTAHVDALLSPVTALRVSATGAAGVMEMVR